MKSKLEVIKFVVQWFLKLIYLFIPDYFQYLFFPKCDVDKA